MPRPYFILLIMKNLILKTAFVMLCVFLCFGTTNAQQISATVNHENGAIIPETGTIEITYNKTVTYSFCQGSVIINGYDMSAFVELDDLRTVLTIPYDASDWNGNTLSIEVSEKAVFDNTNAGLPLSLSFTKAGETSIKKFDAEESTLIHPNPVSDVLHIETENLKQIEIIDMSGRVVIRQTQCSDKERVNVSHLKEGVYFIRLTTRDNRIVVERFVKIN